MEQAKLDAIPREYSLSFPLSLTSLREEREEDVKEIESRPQELSLMSAGALVYKYSRIHTHTHTHRKR
jgi:hypothetical protein